MKRINNFRNKICHFTTVHPPFEPRIFHKELKTLIKAGYDVALIAQNDKNEIVDGIQLIALHKAKNRIQRMFVSTFKIFLLALKQKADIYHFHDPELLPIGVLLKLFTGKKIIYDVHENVRKHLLHKQWMPKWIRKPISIMYLIAENICLLFIDFIIIAEDSYIENYRNRNNIKAIRNFPIISYFLGDEEELVYKKKIINNTLIYIGSIHKLRGVFELIKAMKILKENGYNYVKLKLVGQFDSLSLLSEIKKLLNSYDISNNVDIIGVIPHEQIYKILSGAQIGLAILHPVPNNIQSLWTKLFEYMLASIPIIASNFPLTKELVEENKCGICVDPLKPECIAKAIKYLINHPKIRKEMGENGRKAVIEKYNWETEQKKLLDIYENDLFIGKH